MDFMPYEGTPREGGHDWKRLILALSIGALMFVGAWVLADVAPVSNMSSLNQASMSRPSTTMVAKFTATESDAGPGESESELAKHSVAAH